MAVALANRLKEMNSGVELLFVGTPRGIENRILPGLGLRLESIRVGGLKNVGLRRAFFALTVLPWSLWRSISIVRSFSPSAVVGVGGYSSGPVALAASLLGYPTLTIEPNVHPGLTNRILARFVDRAAVAFEETARWFGSKARVTGIPVRDAFYRVRPLEPSSGPLRVLVFGGSQGSRPINRLICEALAHLPAGSISLVHQAGPADFPWVRDFYRGSGRKAEVMEFIEDMPARFEEADLIVARAGASTVAELTAAGRPALLIPFPRAADDHQTKNALALFERGAALVHRQDTLTGEVLARTLSRLEGDRPRLLEMARASKSLARPGGTGEIIRILEEMAGHGTREGAHAVR